MWIARAISPAAQQHVFQGPRGPGNTKHPHRGLALANPGGASFTCICRLTSRSWCPTLWVGAAVWRAVVGVSWEVPSTKHCVKIDLADLPALRGQNPYLYRSAAIEIVALQAPQLVKNPIPATYEALLAGPGYTFSRSSGGPWTGGCWQSHSTHLVELRPFRRKALTHAHLQLEDEVGELRVKVANR